MALFEIWTDSPESPMLMMVNLSELRNIDS